jgi:hypothetical protein
MISFLLIKYVGKIIFEQQEKNSRKREFITFQKLGSNQIKVLLLHLRMHLI